MKDNFSESSNNYAAFRPGYPDELIEFILSHVTGRSQAWDCGTGNGQLAYKLSPSFEKVFGTDISENQINHATEAKNLNYSIQKAESTIFADDSFDLITVAQAIHWFRFEEFYKEVKRTAKPGAILAVIGYGLHQMDDQIDNLTYQFYHDVVGPYWDPERRYLDERYATIPFPFKEISSPSFSIEMEWRREAYLGYLNTWSALKHYREKVGADPFPDYVNSVHKIWPDNNRKTAKFPLFLRIGRVS